MTTQPPGKPDPIEVPGCPECGSSNVYAIWYGMPARDPDLFWPLNVISAGCMVPIEEPSHECQACGHRWRDPALPPVEGTPEYYEWLERRERGRDPFFD